MDMLPRPSITILDSKVWWAARTVMQHPASLGWICTREASVVACETYYQLDTNIQSV